MTSQLHQLKRVGVQNQFENKFEDQVHESSSTETSFDPSDSNNILINNNYKCFDVSKGSADPKIHLIPNHTNPPLKYV